MEVERWLQSVVGMRVEKIPESDAKTPDFFVSDSRHSYLLEVKDKFPNAQELIRRKETLERGEVYDGQERLSHNRNISNVISDAVKQLSNYNEKSADFKLVWLHARGLYPDVQMQQLEATLYGAVDITDRDTWTEGGATVKPCYFFYFNDFYQFRDTVDGAVVADDHRAKFCLNPYSLRFMELKQSTFCQAFAGGICDPLEQEAAGRAYIADWDGSRRDKKVTLRLLQEKYNRPNLLDFEFTHLSGEMLVQREDNE